jgi:HSP20 family protein
MKYNIVQTPFKSTIFNDSTFDNFFDNFLNLSQNNRSDYMTVPRANILKTENGYSVELAAPGFTRDEFQLNVDNNTLTVGVNTEDGDDYEKNITKREYKFQNFTRSWSLPDSVNIEAIEARYDAGILYIDVPVEDTRRLRKVITVR